MKHESQGMETIHDFFIHELRSILFLEEQLEDHLGPISEEIERGKTERITGGTQG